ncbi:hypothetical protein Oweho_0826 [Owenweeksia hongkongensis DSM 17368]|uniref:Lipoprotein n=1 Tax=Owenweeksia hongkongensis (strain DSM 17368 / CIP 108786 / JCM 12287 / NRRL B-23963 / UST20020801) TaxID=926562 RepID=G8R289_OWEHD|nr:hypothetical protein [Owenweeksia hongkongensis]AEV31839.1 hypothetical protein Oweho_0826 [Owenweeksia hongkongensis DSM 17368]
MKNVLYIGAVAAVVILSSCRKEYTCVCTEDGYTQEYEYQSIKEDDAKSECEDQQDTFNANGQSVVCILD